MRFLKVYGRVLGLLGGDIRIAALLGLANVMVAGLQFLDPVLFGRVIGLLSQSGSLDRAVLWHQAASLLASGPASASPGSPQHGVALQAERLAHRHRVKEMSRYFSHVLAMPLSFHGDIHSGRLMKAMLTGTDGVFGVWLVFFRDQLSTFAPVLVLLPLTLLMNWKLAISLILLVVVFVTVTLS